MHFYPIYCTNRSTGTFTRIGSLMGSPRRGNGRITPYLLDQARSLFARKAGDVIVVGPRCAMPARADSVREGTAA